MTPESVRTQPVVRIVLVEQMIPDYSRTPIARFEESAKLFV
jgi:hypothetical protein